MPLQDGKHNGIAAPKSFPDISFCPCHQKWKNKIRQARVSDFGVLALVQVTRLTSHEIFEFKNRTCW